MASIARLLNEGVPPPQESPMESRLFGELAVELGYVTPEQAAESLARQLQARREGRAEELGRILLKAGHLTATQLAAVLRHQRKYLWICEGCGKEHLVRAVDSRAAPRCVRCGAPLREAAPEEVGASDSMHTPYVSEPGSADRAGMRLGRYEIVREVGRGGMGIVYEARDPLLRRTVALKVLKEDAAGARLMMRFNREALAVARLNHPGVVRVYEAGMIGRTHFVAMEFVDGETLDRRMGTLSVRDVARLFESVARTLQHVHAGGVLHRDVKPSNIILAKDGRILLVDFGLARFEDDLSRLTVSGMMLGTPSYMAPEQVRGRVKEVGSWTDVYGLGASLYESLTRRTLFDGPNAAAIYSQILNDDPPRARLINPKIPAELEAIVMKAVQSEPSRRYASAEEFADDLGRWTNGEPVRARPEHWLTRVVKRARRRPGRYALSTTTVVALLAVGVLAMLWRFENARYEQESEYQLRQMRHTAGLTWRATLAMRRSGDARGMGKFLPDLERICGEVRRRDPQTAEPHYYLGRMYRALFRLDDAMAQQDLALRKEPRYGPSAYERALLSCGRYRSELTRRQVEAFEEVRLRTAGRRADRRPLDPPTVDDLEARHPDLRALRERIVADIEVARGSGALAPEQLECAEAILLFYSFDFDEARRKLVGIAERNPGLEEVFEALTELAMQSAPSFRGAQAEALWREAADWAARGLEEDRGYVPHLTNLARAKVGLAMLRGAADGGPQPLLHEAVGHLDEALNFGGDSTWVLRLRGDLARQIGFSTDLEAGDPTPFYRRALADLDLLLAAVPTDVAALSVRASVKGDWAVFAKDHGDDPEPYFSAAEEDVAAARRLDPRSASLLVVSGQIRINRGSYHEDRGRTPVPFYERAEEDFRAARIKDPSRLDALVAQAMLQTNWANYERKHGGDPSPRLGRAIEGFTSVLAARADYTEALWERSRALGILAEHHEAVRAEAEALFRRAEEDLDAVAKIGDRSVEPTRLRAQLFSVWGRCLRRWGQDPASMYKRALLASGRVLQADPDDVPMRLNRAGVEFSLGVRDMENGEDPTRWYERAAEDARIVLERTPASEDALLTRALARSRLGGHLARASEDPATPFAAAIEDLDALLRVAPRSVRALVERGEIRLNWSIFDTDVDGGANAEGLTNAAVRDFDEALGVDPRNAHASMLRGKCRYKLEEWSGAVADFKRAAELDAALVPQFEVYWKSARAYAKEQREREEF